MPAGLDDAAASSREKARTALIVLQSALRTVNNRRLTVIPSALHSHCLPGVAGD